MKLRNGKNYDLFRWSRSIYTSQLKCSKALLIPLNLYPNKNLQIEIKSKTHPLIKQGLKEGYLIKSSNKIINRISTTGDYKTEYYFLKYLSIELKKNGIRTIIISTE